MYKNKTIAVVVPAYNEERMIERTIKTLPAFLDHIILIDDCSRDKTLRIMQGYAKKDSRIRIIQNKPNKGLGRSIALGYAVARDIADVTAVMAGDAQMDPADLPAILDPIVDGKADYVKGNRLLHKDIKKKMPRFRFFGNAILTLLTKFATGYWWLMDPQCGYTAISKKALEDLDLDALHQGYGYNADFLVRLNILNFKVADVVVNPVYDIEKSKIKYWSYIPKVSMLLLKLFFFRLKEKYLVRDFHPLAFMYVLGMVTTLIGFVYGLYLVYIDSFLGMDPSAGSTILAAFLLLFGLQSFIFGMLFDNENSRSLKV
jgi:glycosyltransferase involved in cell wall biosynthesis